LKRERTGDSAGSRQLPDSEGINAWDALLRCAPLSGEKFLFEKDR